MQSRLLICLYICLSACLSACFYLCNSSICPFAFLFDIGYVGFAQLLYLVAH